MLTFLPLIGIALLFWLLFVRPAQKKQRAVAGMQRALSVGDEVMLTSGIFGTVQALDDDKISVLVADGVTLRVIRAAVGKVTPTDELTAADDELLADDESPADDVSSAAESRDDVEAELSGHSADEPEEK